MPVVPTRTPAYVPAVVARYRLQNREAAPKVEAPFWRFRNATADTTELMIYAEIGFSWWDDGITAADFAKELAAVKTKNLVVRVNSPGGDVFDGLAIGNLLAEHSATKTVKVDALAASIASVIAVKAGTPTRDQPDNKIIMGRQSQMMIHDASGFAMGNAADMLEMADLLSMISDNIANVYADRAGGTAASWRKVMQGEKWYTDQGTVDAGLADEVVSNSQDDASTMQCPTCNGTGKSDGKTCPECGGDGTVPADEEGDNTADNKATCSTCDGTGKIKKGSTKCPDCSGTGQVDDLAAMIRRAYAPAALALPDAARIAARASIRQQEARAKTVLTDPDSRDLDAPADEPEAFDWPTNFVDQLTLATKAVTEPATIDLADWRETFETFRTNMPAPKDVVPRPVDLGPVPEPAVSDPMADWAELLRNSVAGGIRTVAENQPEPKAPPKPAVDLGPAPDPVTPEPETPRNLLAELIGAATNLVANDQPEPVPAPAGPTGVPEDSSPFRLDVADLRRAVKESRF